MKAILFACLVLPISVLAQPFDIYGWKENKDEVHHAWVDSKKREIMCEKYDSVAYNEWANRMHKAAPLVVYKK